MKNYFSAILFTTLSTVRSLGLTLRHIIRSVYRNKKTTIQNSDYFSAQQGIFTVRYPHQTVPVPEVGRYQLHCEIDDCIVCDKCAKICPVDCIDIEAIRSPVEFGRTSDDKPKRLYAARFDIDMSKCCFCGLCTVVCPTECLVMTPTYAFSTNHLADHVFSFSNMSDRSVIEKKQEWESYQQQKKGTRDR